MSEEKSGHGAGAAVAGAGLGLAALFRVCAGGADDVARVGLLGDDLVRAGSGLADDVGRVGGAGAELGAVADDAGRVAGVGEGALAGLGDDAGRVGGLGDDALAALGDDARAGSALDDGAKPTLDDVAGHGLDLAELSVDVAVDDLGGAAPPEDAGRWLGAPRGLEEFANQLVRARRGEVVGFVVRADGAGDEVRLGRDRVLPLTLGHLCAAARHPCWMYTLPPDAPWSVATAAWEQSGDTPVAPAVGNVRAF